MSKGKRKYSLGILAMLLLSAFLFMAETSNAAVNPKFAYQGKLKDSSGVIVPDGSYNLRFRICQDSGCSTVLATETHCYSTDNGSTCTGSGTDQRVSVGAGVFNLLIGSITDLSSLNYNQTLYLEVQVGGSNSTPSWETLLPRKELASVPSAMNSAKLDNLSAATTGDNEHILKTDALGTITSSADISVSDNLNIGTDVILFRGNTDRLDLASGDSLNIISGSVQFGGTTIINSSREIQNITNATIDTVNINGNIISATDDNGLHFYDNAGNGVSILDGGVFVVGQSSGTNPRRIKMEYDTVNNLASIFSLEEGVGYTPLILQRYGGNVGIGTTGPTTLFQVNKEDDESIISIARGGSDLGTSTAIGTLQFLSDFSGAPSEYGSMDVSSTSLSGVRGVMNFNVKSTGGNVLTGLTLLGTSAGVNVGIRNTSPAYELDVTGDVNSTGGFYENGVKITSGSYWTLSGSDLYTTGAYVGIGTTSPATTLDVNGTITSRDIMPEMTGASGNVSVRNIGDSTHRFANLWADEVHIGASSLYVNDKKVIEDVSNVMNFRTDVDQAMMVQTSGVGTLTLQSGNAALTLNTNNLINSEAKGGMQWNVPSDNATKHINFSNASANGNITFVASGANSQVQFGAVDEIDLTASLIDINGNVNISGSITSGSTWNGNTIGVAYGGTGATTLSSNYLLKGNGTSAVSSSIIYDDGTYVGIGTTNPGNKFVVNTDTDGYIAQFRQTGGTNNPGLWISSNEANGLISIAASGSTGAQNMAFLTGSANERMRITSGGNVFINETANSFMTTGLTINSGSTDNEILAFKNSDVSQPVTIVTESDTFGHFTKADSLSGGLKIAGYSDDDISLGSLRLVGSIGVSDPDDSYPAVGIEAYKSNGSTSVSLLGDSERLFQISNNANPKWYINGNGTVTQSGNLVLAQQTGGGSYIYLNSDIDYDPAIWWLENGVNEWLTRYDSSQDRFEFYNYTLANDVMVLADTGDVTFNYGLNLVGTEGIGVYTVPSAQAGLSISDSTFKTTAAHYGIYNTLTKTGGITDYDDTMFGINTAFNVNQSGGEVGYLYGGVFTAGLYNGSVGSSSNNRNIYGSLSQAYTNGGTVNGTLYGGFHNANLDAGTITGNVLGTYSNVDIESGVTIGGNVYGHLISVADDAGATGTVYGLYLSSQAGVDYAIYQTGATPSYLSGKLGIGTLPSSSYALDVSGSDFYTLRLGGGIPLIKFANPDYNSGNGAELYQNDSGSIFLNVNSSTGVFNANASGNIGIGTTDLSARLEIMLAESNGNGGRTMRLRDAGGRNLEFGFGNGTHSNLPTQSAYIGKTWNDSATGGLVFFSGGGTPTTGGIQFYTGLSGSETEAMRIGQDGKVGIGTTSPTVKLQITNKVVSNLAADILAGDSVLGGGVDDIAKIQVQRGNNLGQGWNFVVNSNFDGIQSEAMRISSEGQVGIGTTTFVGSEKLRVNGDVLIGYGGTTKLSLSSNSGTLGLDIISNGSAGHTYYDSKVDDPTYAQIFRTRTNGTPIENFVLRGDNIAIIPTGKLAIGTTSFVGTEKLRVNGSVYVDTSIIVNGTTLNVPDYVFEPEYQLRPIKELEEFISSNRHLPGVASMDEIKEYGLDYNTMMLSILEKTEENTLYIIDNYKKISALEMSDENQITNISDLKLATDSSVSTISELKFSVDANFITINKAMSGISSRLDSSEETISDYEERLSKLEDLELEKQMAFIQGKADTIINFANALNFEDLDGNIKMSFAGKFEMEGIETGNITIKTIDEDAKTIGTATIEGVEKDENGDAIIDEATGNNGKSVTIKTKALTENSKIFVTSKNVTSQPLAVTNRKDGESFDVEIENALDEDDSISFDWWIVEAEDAE